MDISYKLYHFPLCPFSRKARIFLLEKNVQVDLAVENFWEKRKNFVALNPAGEVPVLFSYEDNSSICGSSIICEYLEEKYAGVKLIGDEPRYRAEIKRLDSWFDHKLYNEVVKYVLYEKVIKYYKNETPPNLSYIRAAKINLAYHMDYLSHLLTRHKWLAGNKISLADISAASHLSILDYLGHINWKEYQIVKEWYVIIKSRPSFNEILQDFVVGFKPANNYNDLDF